MSEAIDQSIPTRPRWLPFGLTYVGLVGVPAMLVLVTLRLGEHLAPLGGGVVAPSPMIETAVGMDLGLLVIQMVAVIGVARVVDSLAKYVGQSRVVGEMAAGLLLGPSVLGRPRSRQPGSRSRHSRSSWARR